MRTVLLLGRRVNAIEFVQSLELFAWIKLQRKTVGHQICLNQISLKLIRGNWWFSAIQVLEAATLCPWVGSLEFLKTPMLSLNSQKHTLQCKALSICISIQIWHWSHYLVRHSISASWFSSRRFQASTLLSLLTCWIVYGEVVSIFFCSVQILILFIIFMRTFSKWKHCIYCYHCW